MGAAVIRPQMPWERRTRRSSFPILLADTASTNSTLPKVTSPNPGAAMAVESFPMRAGTFTRNTTIFS